MKMAHAPPGHHSVVGRPSVGGLSFPEYVVYRGEQVQPPFTSFDDFFSLPTANFSLAGLPGVLDLLPNCQT